jgi:hypothetical protein
MLMVEKEDASSAWYWKGLPTRTLAFDGCVLRGIHLKDALWYCVLEIRMKVVVIRKAIKPPLFKSTEANCISAHYYAFFAHCA